MATQREARHAATALQDSIGRYIRRLRQNPIDGDLSLPERSALRWLDRCGPSTPSALAKLEQISPQSMGATVAALEARSLVRRSADPNDGRRSVLSLTAEGTSLLRTRRGARVEQVSTLLRAHFSDDEIAQLLAAAPLIERLADQLR